MLSAPFHTNGVVTTSNLMWSAMHTMRHEYACTHGLHCQFAVKHHVIDDNFTQIRYSFTSKFVQDYVLAKLMADSKVAMKVWCMTPTMPSAGMSVVWGVSFVFAKNAWNSFIACSCWRAIGSSDGLPVYVRPTTSYPCSCGLQSDRRHARDHLRGVGA